jgi:hypothetical protein
MDIKEFGQALLAILFIVYLIVGYKLPPSLAVLLHSMITKVLLFILVILLFVYYNPVLGVLGLIIVIQLIYQSKSYVSSYDSNVFGPNMKRFYPTEKTEQTGGLTAANQFPYTLEQEVVRKMSPLYQYGSYNNNYSFKPVLDDTYNASYVNQQTSLLFGVPKLQSM